MLHWFPNISVAFAGARSRGAVLPGDPVRSEPTARGRHALALGYAAQRRRAASGADAVYWKAAQTSAVERARGIRATGGFARLP